MLTEYYRFLNKYGKVSLSRLRKSVCGSGKTKTFDSFVDDRRLFIKEPADDGTGDYCIRPVLDFVGLTTEKYQKFLRDFNSSPAEEADGGSQDAAPEEAAALPSLRRDEAQASPQHCRSTSFVPINTKIKREKNKIDDDIGTSSNIDDPSGGKLREKFELVTQNLKRIDPYKDQWARLLCERTGKADAVREHWADFIGAYHDHVVRYSNEGSAQSEAKARKYLMNIVECDTSRKDLMDSLLKRTAPRANASDPYRFENIGDDGRRRVNGKIIPKNAPPRPTPNSIWNGEKWVVV